MGTRLNIVWLLSSATLESNQKYRSNFYGGSCPCVFSGGENLGGRFEPELEQGKWSILLPSSYLLVLLAPCGLTLPAPWWFWLPLVLFAMQMKLGLSNNLTWSAMPLPIGH